MVYTPEEKQRMDALMEAFSAELAANPEVDVVHSEKVGYVRLIIEEDADQVFFILEDFDNMLQMFFFDILSDEAWKAMERDRNLTNRTMDYELPRRRIQAVVDTMGPDRAYARKKLDVFIARCKNQDVLP